MSHDYDPNWDYACVDLDELPELTDAERNAIRQAVERAKRELAPAMGFAEGFEVFYSDGLGTSSDGSSSPVIAVYCNGTSTRPVVGFDPQAIKIACEEEGLNLVHQFELSLAHELGHAYQEACGLDHDHDDGFNEDDAEQFGITWVDTRVIELWRLNPALQADAAVARQTPPAAVTSTARKPRM